MRDKAARQAVARRRSITQHPIQHPGVIHPVQRPGVIARERASGWDHPTMLASRYRGEHEQRNDPQAHFGGRQTAIDWLLEALSHRHAMDASQGPSHPLNRLK
jgi:hypothetical protein